MTIVQVGGRRADESTVTAHAPTGLAAVDMPMLEELMADTPAGSRALLRTGIYAVEGDWGPAKNMTIEGAGVYPCFTPKSVNANASGEYPDVGPWLEGTVILQTQAGADGINLSRSGKSINARNFGIVFDEDIRFADTGYGVHARPDVDYSGQPDWGLMHSRVENIHVFGNDGDHHAFRFVNPLLVDMAHLRGYGGPLIEIEGNSSWFNYGNLTISDIFGKWFVGGSKHGISLRAVGGRLNLIAFIRPQINVGAKPAQFPEIVASPSPAQYYFRANDPAEFGVGLTVLQPDFEGSVACPVAFGTGRHFITPEGFFGSDANKAFAIMSNPKGGSALASDLEQSNAVTIITESGASPTVVVGAGSGTGASAAITGSDFRGILSITTGTGPNGGSAQVAATITFALAGRVKNMTLVPANLAAAAVGNLVNASGAGATASIRYTGGGTPAASTLHTWVYRCDPV